MAPENVSTTSAVASELGAMLSNVFGSQISLVVRTSFNGRVQVITRLDPEFPPSSRYFEIALGGVRVEYVRAMRKGPHCHIHIHASSSDWDLVTDPRSIRGERLSEIHIPLGSRHFRPSLEEFLYFLDAEPWVR